MFHLVIKKVKKKKDQYCKNKVYTLKFVSTSSLPCIALTHVYVFFTAEINRALYTHVPENSS